MTRVLLACRVAALLLVGTGPTDAWAREASGTDAHGLTVRLSTVQGLAPEAREALVREVSRIWSRSGVEIAWASPDTPAPWSDGVSLRVLVVSSKASGETAEHVWPVAELLPGVDGQTVAVASLEAARRVLRVTGLADAPVSLVERRLGIVLGRAVAHEIGHALLGPGHARHGLMRARIDAAEFVDLRDVGFDLDGAGSAAARAAIGGRSRLRLAAAQ